jgi:hypothetical protein
MKGEDMLIRFNKETKKLIKKTCKRIAKKLEVDKCYFSVDFNNDSKYNVSICFATDIDDTYADLNTDISKTLESILKGFMSNKDVVFMNRGDGYRAR